MVDFEGEKMLFVCNVMREYLLTKNLFVCNVIYVWISVDVIFYLDLYVICLLFVLYLFWIYIFL